MQKDGRKRRTVRHGSLTGKLILASVEAATGVNIRARRLSMYDKSNFLTFLIDSGACVSVIPRKNAATPDSLVLYAANNTIINTYGTRTLSLNLGLRRPFIWTFIIADVSKPIIGIDFLHHYGLLIDIRNNQLIDPLSNVRSTGWSEILPSSGISTIAPNSIPNSFQSLLRKYPDILLPSNLAHLPQINHSAQHFIITEGPPVTARPRRLPPDRLKIAKDEFDTMLSLGICRPSSSPWASPLGGLVCFFTNLI